LKNDPPSASNFDPPSIKLAGVFGERQIARFIEHNQVEVESWADLREKWG
jgi:hypothetical protein